MVAVLQGHVTPGQIASSSSSSFQTLLSQQLFGCDVGLARPCNYVRKAVCARLIRSIRCARAGWLGWVGQTQIQSATTDASAIASVVVRCAAITLHDVKCVEPGNQPYGQH